jgi:hypothetical protein
MNHRAVPPEVLNANAKGKKKGKQMTLDGVVLKVDVPKEFTPQRILHAVAQFVVCDDQVSQKERSL